MNHDTPITPSSDDTSSPEDEVTDHTQTLLHSEDPEDRCAAARTLSYYGDNDSTQALSKALQDDTHADVRAEAANALSNIATPDAIKSLQNALQTHADSPQTRIAIAVALSPHNPPATHDLLLHALHAPSELPPKLLIKALRALSRDPSEKTVTAVHEIVSSARFSTFPLRAQDALLRTLQHHPSDAIRDTLIAHTADASHPTAIRSAAAKALSAHPHPDTITALEDLLQTNLPELQITAGHTLSDFGTPEAATPLQNALKPEIENDDVRDGWAFALLRLDAAPHVGWEPFLEDPCEGVRNSAREALGIDNEEPDDAEEPNEEESTSPL